MQVVPKGLSHSSSSSTTHPQWLSLRLASKRAGSQPRPCTHRVWPLTRVTSSGHLLTRAPSLLSSSKRCSIRCRSKISSLGLWVGILTTGEGLTHRHRRHPRHLLLALPQMLVVTRLHNQAWTNQWEAQASKPNRSTWPRPSSHPNNSSSPWPKTNWLSKYPSLSKTTRSTLRKTPSMRN